MSDPSKKKSKSRRNCVPLTPDEITAMIRSQTQRNYGYRAPNCVQPDYEKWQHVSVGMSRSQVTSLLGEPLKRYGSYRISWPYVTYGFLALRNVAGEHTYRFTIGYDKDDRVFLKSDPFQHPLSVDGRPSKPQLILPQDRAQYSHYPRLVDVRWQPCSGQYPIEYTVEVGLSMSHEGNYTDHVSHIGLYPPYCLILFPGSQPGRVRVRGINQIGEGEWSDFRYFTFEVEPVIVAPSSQMHPGGAGG
ncbi:MAG: outer membrane protein assembly factor BamE [Tepidisphaeraceae bacterium]|jgi:hypothetical protein